MIPDFREQQGRGVRSPVHRLLTVSEVAEFLGMHPKSVYQMAGRGKLPCVRIGNRLRFDPQDITRWVSARKEG